MVVLHLEDSEHDAFFIASALAEAFPECKVHRVCSREEYEAALQTKDFDLILSDHRIPGYDGLSALELASRKAPEKPFVFMSGTIGEERAIEALKRGAADYVLKDRPSRLAPALRHAMEHAKALEERRRAEAGVRHQASLLDKARDAILSTDPERRITYWNASAERIYGWKAEEVVGRDLFALGLGHEPGRVAAAWAQLLASGEWRGHYQLRNKTGAEICIESTWSLVLGADGQPESVLYIDTDITEKRLMESHLLQADRMDSIGMLAGGVAHDLNNVLAPISMGAELLRSRVTEKADLRIIENIERSAAHGASLVRQLLTFARGGEGERSKVDSGALLSDVGKLLRQSLPRAIQFSVAKSPSLPAIEADSTQIKQVLLNLGLNARDAMPSGGVLTMQAGTVVLDQKSGVLPATASAGTYLHIAVIDTGTGIRPEIVSKIFDPFFTTKAIGKGTGLGLSTAAGIVKSHGGFMTVESALGVGTRFHVFLPSLADASV